MNKELKKEIAFILDQEEKISSDKDWKYSEICRLIDKAYKAGEEAERERCMKDVCPECDGNCPPYESQPSKKPNAAGNYTHKAKNGSGDVLCQASGIISRSNFKGEVLLTLNQQDDE